ncbi:MAG: alpha/beta fold hydrolase [Syntrophobacteraceae bacterium]
MQNLGYLIAAILVAPVIILGAMILFGHPEAPPPLEAVVKDSALIAGFSQSLPPLEFYQARDAQKLAYRLYEGRPGRGVVIAVHGSTGSSIAMHAIAAALQARGHTVYAIDLRGHGESGKLGDVSYIDQPLDDLADLLDKIDGVQPPEKKILLGHSSGGTFALKVAADRLSRKFDGFVALSPPLGASKSTNKPNAGGWANAAVPRIIALSILNRFGVHILDHLPVVAFATEANPQGNRATVYSHALLTSLSLPRHWEPAVAKIDKPTVVMIGETDEIFNAAAYGPEIAAVNPRIRVVVVPQTGHMDMVLNSNAFLPEGVVVDELMHAAH